MIRSAPSCSGGQYPEQPDRAVADDGDGLAGPGFGGDGGEPAGAEHVGGGEEVWDQVVGGHLRGGDEGAVGQRHAHPLGLCGAGGAERLLVRAGRLVAGAADLAGVVGGEKRPDHELARLHGGDRRSDLLDDAAVLVTHRPRPVERFDPAVGPQVRSADAGRRQPDDRIGRFQDGRFGVVLDPHVTGGGHDGNTHGWSLLDRVGMGLHWSDRQIKPGPEFSQHRPGSAWESLPRRVLIGNPSRGNDPVRSKPWTTESRSASF